MFNQYNEMTNYMTYDSSSLNQYSYKNIDDVFPGLELGAELPRPQTQSRLRHIH